MTTSLTAAVQTFFDEEILPRHRDWLAHVRCRREPVPFLDSLRAKAKTAALWNLGLADRLSNRDYAPIAEIMGRLPWAPEVFNCQAPDIPNMIMLQHAATAEQRKWWLEPLMEGRVRSAFGMTEPEVASSDATNIATTLQRDGGDWVVNGRKWFITGAAHPACAFVIVLGVSRPQAARTARHSCVIVPMTTPGLTVVREQRFMGWEDAVAPIAELEFRDVRVPRSHLLGAEGEGFAAAQVRLGPARLHHCMRALGSCEVLIELMMARAGERKAFGRSLIDYDATQAAIARSRIDVEQARLLVLRAAERLDRDGHHASRRDVSMVKVAVPEMAQRVADRAMQLFGAMGGGDDAPIHRAFALARLLRIADGPDEVHLRQIFRQEPPARWTVAQSPYMARPAV